MVYNVGKKDRPAESSKLIDSRSSISTAYGLYFGSYNVSSATFVYPLAGGEAG